MKRLKQIMMAAMLIAMALMLAACGGDSAPAPTRSPDGTFSGAATDALNIVFCADLLNEEAAQQYVDALTAELDMFKDGAVKVNLACIMTGGDADPAMQMAGIMKLSAAIAAQEVDVLIADEANAARNARADNFFALSDIMTAGQIAALNVGALSYEELNEEGHPAGNMLPACGIDLSADERLQAVFGKEQIGAFAVGNAPNLENAKALMNALGTATAAE